MFNAEYELLEFIEKEYRVKAIDVLNYTTKDELPDSYKALGKNKIFNWFLENGYIRYFTQEKGSSGEIEITPKGREILQEHRNQKTMLDYEAADQKRKEEHINIARGTLVISAISLLISFAAIIISLIL